jgi:predicted O-linked N-acetylglucosamine transferase (SPINDLY family)
MPKDHEPRPRRNGYQGLGLHYSRVYGRKPRCDVVDCLTLVRVGSKILSKIRLLCVGRDLKGGGAERVQLTLLEHLDRDKFDIQLFYLSGQGVLHELIPPDITPTYGVQIGRASWRDRVSDIV